MFELKAEQEIIDENHVCITCDAKTILVRDPNRVWIRYNSDGSEHWHFHGLSADRYYGGDKS